MASSSPGRTSAPGRTSEETGSPGARFANANVTMETPRRIGIATRTLRSTRLRIAADVSYEPNATTAAGQLPQRPFPVFDAAGGAVKDRIALRTLEPVA